DARYGDLVGERFVRFWSRLELTGYASRLRKNRGDEAFRVELAEHDFPLELIVTIHTEIFVNLRLGPRDLGFPDALVAGGQNTAVEIEAVLACADSLSGPAFGHAFPFPSRNRRAAQGSFYVSLYSVCAEIP